MASSSKKRTTMAKIARENKLRERRFEKQARKDARKYAAANPPLEGEGEGDETAAAGDDLVEPEQATEHAPGPLDA